MSEQQANGGSPGGTDKNPNYESEGSLEGEGLEGGRGGDRGRKPNLGKPSREKSAVFLNIVQKAFGPPPPLLFEHLSYFAGGVF